MDECCAVCAEPLEWTGSGPCGHTQTCSKCVARLRFALKDRRCVICQQESEVVFFTRYMGNYTRKLTMEQFHALKGGREFRHLSVINGYFDDVSQFNSIKALCSYTHPEVDEGASPMRFQNMRELKEHIKEHLGKQFCEICLAGRKVFVCEQLLYTPKAAKLHLTKGDLHGPLAEGGFKGHPMCEFCRSRFFSDTELFNHNSAKHETCFLCRRENPGIYKYYRDYRHLEEHFQNVHHPCPHPQCKEAHFVAFRSEQELKHHFAAEHEPRSQRNQAQAVETNFQYRRPAIASQRGRGRFQLDARQEYAPSGGMDDLAPLHDPNGFPEARLVQLTDEDFPSIVDDAPRAQQGTWPVRGFRSATGLRDEHFPSLPGQSSEGRKPTVQRNKETMASRVAATRSPIPARHSKPLTNPNLQTMPKFASSPQLQREGQMEKQAPNWPVQKQRKEPAAEAKPVTSWVTLSKGNEEEFPSLGVTTSRTFARPKWGRSQEKPKEEAVPKPTVPSVSDASAFPSLGDVSASAPRFSAPRSAASTLKVSEGLESANKILIKKLKHQMDSVTFQEFHREAGVFLKDGLSAEIFHKHLVERGLAHYIAEVASLCPNLSKGKQLLSVHGHFIEQCKEVPTPPPSLDQPLSASRIPPMLQSWFRSQFWSNLLAVSSLILLGPAPAAPPSTSLKQISAKPAIPSATTAPPTLPPVQVQFLWCTERVLHTPGRCLESMIGRKGRTYGLSDDELPANVIVMTSSHRLMYAFPANRLPTRCRALKSDAEVARRIEKTRNAIRFFDRLAPYDNETFSAASLIWSCIADIPEERRVELLGRLNPRDIEKIWHLSAHRYDTTKETLQEIMTYSPLDDLPEEPHEVVRFEGKMATWLGWRRFSKLLFLEPESYAIHGRTSLSRLPFGDAFYPLYFRLTPRQLRIPATGEMSEMSMEYLDAWDSQYLTKQSLPDANWPLPRDPLFPFHGGVTEYLRPIGPGCYIGTGWREPRLELSDIGRKFLAFVIVKIPESC